MSCDSDAPKVGSARSDYTRVVKVNCRKTNCRKTRPCCVLFIITGDKTLNMRMHADLLSLQRVASSPETRLKAATSTTSLMLLFSSNFKSCCGGLYVTLILADVPLCITSSDGSTARLVLLRFWNPDNARKSNGTFINTWGGNEEKIINNTTKNFTEIYIGVSSQHLTKQLYSSVSSQHITTQLYSSVSSQHITTQLYSIVSSQHLTTQLYSNVSSQHLRTQF